MREGIGQKAKINAHPKKYFLKTSSDFKKGKKLFLNFCDCLKKNWVYRKGMPQTLSGHFFLKNHRLKKL